MDARPLVSVSVVNYNGMKFLPNFFDSLFNQTYKNFEVLFIDNNSVDESVAYVRKHFPQVRVIENKDNSGYAEGNNIGYHAARGDFLLIMNNDTILQEDLIEKLLEAYEKIPRLGVVQPMVKLMNDREKLDACGSFWTATGFNYHYGIYKPARLPLYNRSFPVYSVKGMCMMIPRKVIERVGLFDKDFWCYFEETDFCHRVWLAGYECWYYPESLIYHHMGGTSSKKPSYVIQFHSFKNRLCSYLKNLGLKEMLLVLPVYFLMNIAWSLAFLLRFDVRNFLVVYRAIGWNILRFPKTLKKREEVQKRMRRLTDSVVFAKTRKNPRLSYYYYLLTGLEQYRDAEIPHAQ